MYFQHATMEQATSPDDQSRLVLCSSMTCGPDCGAADAPLRNQYETGQGKESFRTKGMSNVCQIQ